MLGYFSAFASLRSGIKSLMVVVAVTLLHGICLADPVPACSDGGAVSTYIGYGATGCTVGSFLIQDFSFSVSGPANFQDYNLSFTSISGNNIRFSVEDAAHPYLQPGESMSLALGFYATPLDPNWTIQSIGLIWSTSCFSLPCNHGHWEMSAFSQTLEFSFLNYNYPNENWAYDSYIYGNGADPSPVFSMLDASVEQGGRMSTGLMADITSVQRVSVPEPASFGLFLVGLVTAVIRKK
jgi:hypothetical protein